MIKIQKLALILGIFSMLGNAEADIYSEHSNQGDIYIKTTKNKAGLIRFQKCQIPTTELSEYDKENCSDVLPNSSRTFYSPQTLTLISKALKNNATTGTAVSIIFMLGAGLIQNAETLMASKTISPRVLSGKKVLLSDFSNKSLEDIRAIEKKGEFINQNMASYLSGLRKVLEKYNKDYK